MTPHNKTTERAKRSLVILNKYGRDKYNGINKKSISITIRSQALIEIHFKILELLASGMTLQQVANHLSRSKERIRQREAKTEAVIMRIKGISKYDKEWLEDRSIR
jgi:DNA-directed RNA polymerase sigma subunit (sigma70/sigma32)